MRDLLKLATSPNAHEAALARTRAEELMARNGLTENDIIDDVDALADEKRDPQRAELAAALAIIYGCKVFGSDRGGIAFKGKPAVTAKAVDAYQTIFRMVDRSSRTGIISGSPEPVVDAWRMFFWLGFLEAMWKRVHARQDEIKAASKPKKKPRRSITPLESVAYETYDDEEPMHQGPPKIVTSAQDALGGARRVGVDTNWLANGAYHAGSAIGNFIDIENPTEQVGVGRQLSSKQNGDQ